MIQSVRVDGGPGQGSSLLLLLPSRLIIVQALVANLCIREPLIALVATTKVLDTVERVLVRNILHGHQGDHKDGEGCWVQADAAGGMYPQAYAAAASSPAPQRSLYIPLCQHLQARLSNQLPLENYLFEASQLCTHCRDHIQIQLSINHAEAMNLAVCRLRVFGHSFRTLTLIWFDRQSCKLCLEDWSW